MPFEILRNDITNMRVDAIVNTANPLPVIGAGTDAAIHQKAGPRLLKARQRIGSISVGSAAITPAYALHAKYVIHTAGPVWEGGAHGEERLLRSCYEACLKLALEHGCKSIAFPLISAGSYGFPKEKALQTAISAFSAFLPEHDMQISLVVFDQDAFRLSGKLFQHVASYIDENYVDALTKTTYRAAAENRRPRPTELCKSSAAFEARPPCYAAAAPKAVPRPVSLEELLNQADAGFSETLLKLINESGKTDSQIYKKANISKQHFSKIRSNPHYKPTKPTAIALALALELDLEKTRDLLGRAGYALTSSSKFDLIIRYFIEQGNYNIIEINIALYEFDQPLLGA